MALIGRGGMGVVFNAFDTVLQRVVAVKVLAPEMAANSTARRRFLREARAAAAVCHEHIVTIHAVEEQAGVPYIVMQYVAGISLEQKIRQQGPLEVKEVLRIGLQTAQGLAMAHAHGLVHRDIKPANILLENGIEKVRITDFGLARAMDDGAVSQSGVVAGTPQYMAPEQARGEPVSPRADLFSLGGVLYAMCTGQPPFNGSNSLSILKRVCEENPRRIQETKPDVPAWLIEVIGKLLAKAADDRYETATEVAELLQQHLAVLQQPTGVILRAPAPTAKTAPVRSRPRRWPWAAAAGMLLLLAAVVVYRIATDNGDIVIESDDPDVEVLVKQGDQTVTILDGKSKQKVTLPTGEYTLSLSGDAEGLKAELPQTFTLRRGDKKIVTIKRLPPGEISRWQAHESYVHHLALSPDGKTLASAAGDRRVRLRSLETGKLAHTLEGHMGMVSTVAFSPDGKVLSSSGHDGAVIWWDVAAGKLLGTFEGHANHVYGLVFAQDSKSLFTGGNDKTLRRVDLGTGKDKVLANFPEGVRCLARHENTLAVATWGDSLVRLWDAEEEKEKASIKIAGRVAGALAFDPTGQMLVEGGEGGDLGLYEPTGKLKFALKGHELTVLGVAFAQGGRFVLSVGGLWNRPNVAGEFKVWDTATGKEVANLDPGLGCVYSVAVAADGKTCFTAHHDGTIRKWRLPPVPGAGKASGASVEPPARLEFEEVQRFHHGAYVGTVALSPDGKLALTEDSRIIRVWEIQSGKELRRFEGHTSQVQEMVFTSDSKRVLSVSRDGTCRLWEVDTGVELRCFEGHQGQVWGAALLTGDEQALTGGHDNMLRLWKLDTGKEIRCVEAPTIVSSLAVSADGTRALSCGNDKVLRLWDLTTHEQLLGLEHPWPLRRAVFSPDGAKALTGPFGGQLILWDLKTGLEIRRFSGPPPATVYGLAFTPDGRHALSASGHGDDSVRLWDVASGKQLAQIPEPGAIYGMALSRDGKYVLTNGGNSKVAKLYRLPQAVWPAPAK
jgi:WD40 repeat protein